MSLEGFWPSLGYERSVGDYSSFCSTERWTRWAKKSASQVKQMEKRKESSSSLHTFRQDAIVEYFEFSFIVSNADSCETFSLIHIPMSRTNGGKIWHFLESTAILNPCFEKTVGKFAMLRFNRDPQPHVSKKRWEDLPCREKTDW